MAGWLQNAKVNNLFNYLANQRNELRLDLEPGRILLSLVISEVFVPATYLAGNMEEWGQYKALEALGSEQTNFKTITQQNLPQLRLPTGDEKNFKLLRTGSAEHTNPIRSLKDVTKVYKVTKA